MSEQWPGVVASAAGRDTAQIRGLAHRVVQPDGGPAQARGPAPDPAPARAAFRLHGRPRRGALTLHVLTSVGWFGIAVVVLFCWIAARTTTDQAFSHALYQLIAMSPWLSVPAGIAAAVTGALLGLGSRFGLIRHWWVVIKIIITIAAVLVDALVVSVLARDVATSGRGVPLLYGSSCAHIVILAIATILSVFKPRGLTPWGRRRTPQGRRSGIPQPRGSARDGTAPQPRGNVPRRTAPQPRGGVPRGQPSQ